MPSKIYFKGAGLVTSIGSSVEQALASVEQNDYQPPSKIGVEQANQVIEIPYFTINKPGPAVGVDRIYQIIDSVVQQAIDDSGLSMAQISEMGLFVGSTSFDMPKCEMALKASDCTDEDLAIHVPPFNRLTSYIQSRFSINGPVFTFNTACTSSANALIYAAEFIRRGDIDRALVLGLEFYNEVTALGFVGLELISKLGMRPFDNNRDGLYLGEGCGALIISAEAGNDDFAYVAGANLGDNFSITACNPEGAAVHTVIDNALSQAGISTSDIALIKTHGTASLSNDEAEAAGLVTVFDGQIHLLSPSNP